MRLTLAAGGIGGGSGLHPVRRIERHGRRRQDLPGLWSKTVQTAAGLTASGAAGGPKGRDPVDGICRHPTASPEHETGLRHNDNELAPVQRPDLLRRRSSGAAQLKAKREQRLRRGDRINVRCWPPAAQRQDRSRRQRRHREQGNPAASGRPGRHGRLHRGGRGRGQATHDDAQTGLREKMIGREACQLDGQRDKSAAVRPHRGLRQQRRVGRQPGVQSFSLFPGRGLLAGASGACIGQTGQSQLVLQPLMGLAVRVGTELPVRQSAQKRQFVPAIQTPHSASVILPHLSSASAQLKTMREFTEFVAIGVRRY